MVNGKEHTLSIVGKNGVEWTEDMINAPDLYNQETEQVEMDEETFAYWAKEIEAQEKIDALVDTLTPDLETEIAAIIRDYAEDRETALAALELLSDQAENEANANQAADAVRINIKSAREAAGISQTELANRIGTTRQQIGKYETGEQDMTVARLFQIAAALGVEPDTLIK